MSEFRIGEKGVPQLSSGDIEKKVEEVIEFFGPDVLHTPCETPVLQFVDEMANRYDFSYDLSQSLGSNAHGHRVLGKFIFKPRKILVDQSLNDNPRQKFVLGHEFGHLILHRNLLIKRENYTDIDISDTEHDLVTGRKILLTPRDWLEWQANRFANALILPRATFMKALIVVQETLEIHRNLGRIYLDDQKYSLRDFMRTIEGLQEIYKVTPANIEIRLSDLGLLIDVRGKNTNHISELFLEE